jgi:hypothetical protein
MRTEEQSMDSEGYGNVLNSHSFQTVEDRILQSDIDEIISMYSPKPDPYRINQINQYTEGSE